MSDDFTICIGTVGTGVWQSSNAGASWRRSRMQVPFHAQPGEIQIRALQVSPHDPAVMYAGSEVGLYVSEDRGASWAHIDSPADGDQIWSLALDPADPDTVWLGTKPPAVYRTRDRGQHWERIPIEITPQCVAGPPKVTNIIVDPTRTGTIWVGVEIDGVYRSDDDGQTWTRLPDLGAEVYNQDVHGLQVISRPEETTIRATTPDGIWTSRDNGQRWVLHAFPRFRDGDKFSYCRGLASKAGDPSVLFVGNGDFIPGKIGTIQRSCDGGKTWRGAALDEPPNSTVYWFGTHPANPDIVVANSLFGQIYKTLDGGETWEKLGREFGEIRAIAWTPN